MHVKSGLPPLCPLSLMDIDDYYVPLKNLNFIETGSRVSQVFAVVGYYVLVLGVLSFAISVFLQVTEYYETEVPGYIFVSFVMKWVFPAVSLVAYLVLTALAFKLKRQYLHFGVFPGGGQRGKSNSYGGNSPFYVLLKKGLQVGVNGEDGAFMSDFEDVVSAIRSAAVVAKQRDKIYRARNATEVGKDGVAMFEAQNTSGGAGSATCQTSMNRAAEQGIMMNSTTDTDALENSGLTDTLASGAETIAFVTCQNLDVLEMAEAAADMSALVAEQAMDAVESIDMSILTSVYDSAIDILAGLGVV